MNDAKPTLIDLDFPLVSLHEARGDRARRARLVRMAIAAAAALVVAVLVLRPIADRPGATAADADAASHAAPRAQGFSGTPVLVSHPTKPAWKTYFADGVAVGVPGYWRFDPTPALRWVFGAQLQMSIGVGGDDGDVSVCLTDACHLISGRSPALLERALMRLLASQGFEERSLIHVSMGSAPARAACGLRPLASHQSATGWCLIFDFRDGRPVVVTLRHFQYSRPSDEAGFPSDTQRRILANLHVEGTS